MNTQPRTVSVRLNAEGVGEVAIDGHQIAGITRRIAIESIAGQPATVLVECPAGLAIDAEVKARVVLMQPCVSCPGDRIDDVTSDQEAPVGDSLRELGDALDDIPDAVGLIDQISGGAELSREGADRVKRVLRAAQRVANGE